MTVDDFASDQRHVQVRFDGLEPLDYRAHPAAAENYAEAAVNAGAHVTIDDNVDEALPPLPCQSLWVNPVARIERDLAG